MRILTWLSKSGKFFLFPSPFFARGLPLRFIGWTVDRHNFIRYYEIRDWAPRQENWLPYRVSDRTCWLFLTGLQIGLVDFFFLEVCPDYTYTYKVYNLSFSGLKNKVELLFSHRLVFSHRVNQIRILCNLGLISSDVPPRAISFLGWNTLVSFNKSLASPPRDLASLLGNRE